MSIGKMGAMLTIMARQGMIKEGVATLMEMAGFHRDHCSYVSAPIIVHKSPWMADIPPWMFTETIGERVVLCVQEHDRGEVGHCCGPIEIATVMMPAIQEAPMNREMADLYLYCTVKACSRHYGKSETEYWKFIGEPEPTPFRRIEHEFNQLGRDIRRKVMNAARDRERAARKARKAARTAENKPKSPTHPKEDTLQLTMF